MGEVSELLWCESPIYYNCGIEIKRLSIQSDCTIYKERKHCPGTNRNFNILEVELKLSNTLMLDKISTLKDELQNAKHKYR